MIFTRAIVRKPGKNFAQGLTTAANDDSPNYEILVKQHEAYISVLRSIGLEVILLDALPDHPDAYFVEDTAVVTADLAVITNPGAASRRGEVEAVAAVLNDLNRPVRRIHAPGTLDAGDVMMVGSHYYIGLSGRTNAEGARQLTAILNDYGMTGSTIKLDRVLHLKTGVAYLENNYLAATGEFLCHPDFRKYKILEIAAEESYAANCVWINDRVLVPSGYPAARKTVEAAGYLVITVDVSEFRKVDGGLSCLSLRF